MPRPASDTDVPPDVPGRGRETTEIKRPTVASQTRAEGAIEEFQSPDQDGDEALVAEGEEGDFARRTGGEVVGVEEVERADQVDGGAVGDMGKALDKADDVGGGAEGVDVAAAAAEPAVDAVGEGSGVGDRDIDRAGGPEDAAELAEGVLQIDEMLEAVIGDDGVEGGVGEGEAGGVGRDLNFTGNAGRGEIETDNGEVGAGRLKAAGPCAEVEDARAGGQSYGVG